MKIANLLLISTCILFTGCQKKQNNPPVLSTKDYTVFNELKSNTMLYYSFKEYIDETLGFKDYTFIKFAGDNSPYDQIILECIHKDNFKLDPVKNKFDLPKLDKNEKLSNCIKNSSNSPVSIDTILYSSILGIHNKKDDKEFDNLIDESKKDNVLTVYEYLKIGILAEQTALVSEKHH